MEIHRNDEKVWKIVYLNGFFEGSHSLFHYRRKYSDTFICFIWTLIYQLSKFMVRSDSTRSQTQSSLRQTHLLLSFSRSIGFVRIELRWMRFTLFLAFATRESKVQWHARAPNWTPTTKIKLIWNLQIYDVNNPFDRTACFTFKLFLGLNFFRFLPVLRLEA